ncbi:lipid-A-disaccharide synthase [Legionella londiniensis]|uniref:Lipid-A-disaccharide synthase n=1 Tax=Legionella londiniensis TaxID=45068 RepID=A0A0W0VMG0_9GAMM|nr:lipid-A-disaccharide synthase [Legionella londiniensis]KTD21272.1 lipid-A-disaccharide synthase [Legionella londiniensis]STX93298.1 lipid-A-disaccharide synthase [Legionella londiniensis]
MQSARHIVIVAGEESGDMHAASFIKELKRTCPNIRITGIGGRHMQEAGTELVSDLARFGVTGLSEVIKHFRTIKRAFKDMQAHLKACKPDLLVLVDYPGFNLRLARYAKRVLNIRVLYYISPQIWAWKANRIHTIRSYVDRMAVIFPFEKYLYQKAGVPVSYVGHPLVEQVKNYAASETIYSELQLPANKRLIAMLPGSRTHEIEQHMPILIQSAEQLSKRFQDIHFVLPVAGTINPDIIHRYTSKSKAPITLLFGNALAAVAASRCVVVASGTASLECALLNKPMCIIYKASLLTYMVAVKVIQVNYLGLCNLLQNAMIVPELLQYDCNATELTKVIERLLNDSEYSEKMSARLAKVKQSLSLEEADCSISDLIKNELGFDKT